MQRTQKAAPLIKSFDSEISLPIKKILTCDISLSFVNFDFLNVQIQYKVLENIIS